MEFFLARDEPLVLSQDFSIGIRGKRGSVTMQYHVFEESPGYDEKMSCVLIKLLDFYKELLDMDVRIILIKEPQLHSNGEAIIQLGEEKSFLKEVCKVPGVDGVRVNVTVQLEDQSTGEVTPPTCRLVTKGMSIQDDPEVVCQDSSVPFGYREWFNLFKMREITINASITIQVIVTIRPIQQIVNNNRNEMEMFKRMFEDSTHSDLVIVPSDGTPVKCHKCVLCASSPVFQRMFHHKDMKEAKTSRVEMPDMNEESVRSFLEYIYFRGEDKPQEVSSIAFDLWVAADKYEVIPELKRTMRNILLAKPVEWFDVGVAVNLFQIARNLDADQQPLKIKAVQVIKRNSANLLLSSTFKQMFAENPEAAMELYQISNSLPY